jgi:indole-3-glycerol phosphate synthase
MDKKVNPFDKLRVDAERSRSIKSIDQIVSKTKEDLEERKRRLSLDRLKELVGKEPVLPFAKAIQNPKKGSVAIISEIKLASPSDQYLGVAQDIQSRTKVYEQAGVDCISVVTEKHFFKGDPSFVRIIKNTVSLPVLQKDFVVDQYQVHEAKKAGADAILLIAKIVSPKMLSELVKKTIELGMEPICEVQTEHELADALATDTNVIAVNARDLDTFEVDVDRACELLKMISNTFIKLGFSGVTGKAQAEKYKNAGVDGILIGTSLMKAGNISEFIGRIRV